MLEDTKVCVSYIESNESPIQFESETLHFGNHFKNKMEECKRDLSQEEMPRYVFETPKGFIEASPSPKRRSGAFSTPVSPKIPFADLSVSQNSSLCKTLNARSY
jgi:oligoendopeptidase F